MKKIMVALFLVLASTVFAEEKQVAKLHLELNIDKLCSENEPFCVIDRTISLGGIEVELLPVAVRDEIGNVDCELGGWLGGCFKNYRGIWSKVIEKDGFRAIGIVSINKTIRLNDVGTKVETSYYDIAAEIIGEKGLEAKLRLSTDDLAKISRVSLEAPIRNIMNHKYQTSLDIGPVSSYPCAPGSTACTGDETDENTASSVKLIMGSLK